MSTTDDRDEVDEQIAALPSGLKATRVNPWVVHITETVDDGWGATFEVTHSVVQTDDGSWVKARWDNRSAQWHSRDLDKHGMPRGNRASFVYAYGPTPEALVDVGIRAYPTLAKALGV